MSNRFNYGLVNVAPLDWHNSPEFAEYLLLEHGDRGAVRYMIGVAKAIEEQVTHLQQKIDDRDRAIRQLRDAEAERSEYPVDVRLVDVKGRLEAYERRFSELRKLVCREVV